MAVPRHIVVRHGPPEPEPVTRHQPSPSRPSPENSPRRAEPSRHQPLASTSPAQAPASPHESCTGTSPASRAFSQAPALPSPSPSPGTDVAEPEPFTRHQPLAETSLHRAQDFAKPSHCERQPSEPSPDTQAINTQPGRVEVGEAWIGGLSSRAHSKARISAASPVLAASAAPAL